MMLQTQDPKINVVQRKSKSGTSHFQPEVSVFTNVNNQFEFEIEGASGGSHTAVQKKESAVEEFDKTRPFMQKIVRELSEEFPLSKRTGMIEQLSRSSRSSRSPRSSRSSRSSRLSKCPPCPMPGKRTNSTRNNKGRRRRAKQTGSISKRKSPKQRRRDARNNTGRRRAKQTDSISKRKSPKQRRRDARNSNVSTCDQPTLDDNANSPSDLIDVFFPFSLMFWIARFFFSS